MDWIKEVLAYDAVRYDSESGSWYLSLCRQRKGGRWKLDISPSDREEDTMASYSRTMSKSLARSKKAAERVVCGLQNLENEVKAILTEKPE